MLCMLPLAVFDPAKQPAYTANAAHEMCHARQLAWAAAPAAARPQPARVPGQRCQQQPSQRAVLGVRWRGLESINASPMLSVPWQFWVEILTLERCLGQCRQAPHGLCPVGRCSSENKTCVACLQASVSFDNDQDPRCTVITLSGRNETALLMQVGLVVV